MERHTLVQEQDLVRLRELSERHRLLLLRIEAELEAGAQYDRPSRQLRDLQAEAAGVRRDAIDLLDAMRAVLGGGG